MRILTLLGILCSFSSARAGSPDWTRTCGAVSHFAELVSAARDESLPAGNATLTVQHLLNYPDVLSPDVAKEITRQVYETPSMTPIEEAASFRRRCLTPIRASADKAGRPVDTLVPIKLDVGINHIATPEGVLDVNLSWEDDGNGHGHDVFTATAPGARTVFMPDGYSIADDPADDQDMRRSVRFARGLTDGEDAVVLLVAQRDPGRGPTRTTYQVYRLRRDPQGFRFALLFEAELPSHYCNADAALSVASGLMLRGSYRGPHTVDGCPSKLTRNQ
jgi:hypothetical protein